MRTPIRFCHAALLLNAAGLLWCANAVASSGDPQLMTDHPWYPGELSCSTFERLFKTQAELYQRVTGRGVESDEDKALASWYWRNLHYAHAEEGKADMWDKGFRLTGEKNREYWLGLFAHGLGLCGTTHAQMCAEMDVLLGRDRSRVVGVSGHNSFEVWLTGGAYGEGRWALLDHDISTVIFSPDGARLLSIPEVKADLANLGNPGFKAERQRGWRIAGLADGDTGVYSAFGLAEYAAGYAGAPPIVHLRAGEALRRYPKPGLEDGTTFVYWGRNRQMGKIPGPARERSWVNQPDKMYQAKACTPPVNGQARYGNAVYTYTPDFQNGSYKEGVLDESADHVTFEFYTPYVIGCTPANTQPWAIYDPGAKNGLVLKGTFTGTVQVSTDQGKTWQDGGAGQDGLDLTDLVKGHQQYWIKFGAGAPALAGTGLTLRTVCQCNPAIVPRLKDGGTKVTFQSSGLALLSAGPNKDQAEARLVGGKFGTPSATLELATPRKEKAVALHAATWQSSGCPPKPAKYHIEYSTDGGATWLPILKDRTIVQRAPDPADFWSQSMCWGVAELKDVEGPMRVKFSNSGGRAFQKCEAHLAYRAANPGPTEVTFGWKEGGGELKTASKTFPHSPAPDSSWNIPTGAGVDTAWIEYRSAPGSGK